MKKQDFSFELPEHLIANQPCNERTGSRLMLLDPSQQSIKNSKFNQILESLNPNDCLIFNNTKVIPARLFGKRESGGKVEILLERIIQEEGKDKCIAQLRASNTPKPGAKIMISDSFSLTVIGREGAFFKLDSGSQEPLLELIEQHGEMPLPPYIQRDVEEAVHTSRMISHGHMNSRHWPNRIKRFAEH
ncbi:MAG: S-adenosylmethionine:tRNA ribosyltransferase-isomerase [Kangiellaceae bacterium]|nr:S-adenosylmethionine:tRNA ribosyltransferase-isomerase [Kangiellaceae bacterium]